jgi:LDH2 family malate/lactate/ureidoglycolate dehydrogenase
MEIASTAVERGKTYLAVQNGTSILAGWAVGEDGRPTTDPQAGMRGAVLPMAEHNGYVVAMMMDILSGVLTGSSFGKEIHGPYQAERRSGAVSNSRMGS